MKFYAKSKKRIPGEVQLRRLSEALERLGERLGEELTEEEREILRRASAKIRETEPEGSPIVDFYRFGVVNFGVIG